MEEGIKQFTNFIDFLNKSKKLNIKERLERLIEEEERKRRESAKYFNKYKEILEDLFEVDKERKRLGFTNEFEHAIYELLLKITRD